MRKRKYSDAWLGCLDMRTGRRSGSGLTIAEARRAEKKGLRNGAFLSEDYPYKTYYFKSMEKLDEWCAKAKKVRKAR